MELIISVVHLVPLVGDVVEVLLGVAPVPLVKEEVGVHRTAVGVGGPVYLVRLTKGARVLSTRAEMGVGMARVVAVDTMEGEEEASVVDL